MTQPYTAPKVVFFDAVGTLFGVKGSVGQIYADLAQSYGVQSDPAALNQGFFAAFKTSSPMAFPGAERDSIPALELEWWKAIAQETFRHAGVLEQFTHFDHFFDHLYEHFATADPWFVYPDTVQTLQQWQAKGIDIGIISNFDSRIHRVLIALGLSSFFDSITISTDVGAAKPDAAIFAAALAKHNCPPSLAWHIGDSIKDDYHGARAVGLRGIWLERSL